MYLVGCTRVWCIGALVHLVHGCIICEINQFLSRGGSQGIHLTTALGIYDVTLLHHNVKLALFTVTIFSTFPSFDHLESILVKLKVIQGKNWLKFVENININVFIEFCMDAWKGSLLDLWGPNFLKLSKNSGLHTKFNKSINNQWNIDCKTKVRVKVLK